MGVSKKRKAASSHLAHQKMLVTHAKKAQEKKIEKMMEELRANSKADRAKHNKNHLDYIENTISEPLSDVMANAMQGIVVEQDNKA